MSASNNWYHIKDMDELINSSRALVFNNFGKHDKDDNDIVSFAVDPSELQELDSVLSFEESKNIVYGLVKKQIHKISKKIRYLVNDDIYEKIIMDLNDRMVSNILNGLVNKGLVETAYDDEANDFIFWIKEENNNFGEKNEY